MDLRKEAQILRESIANDQEILRYQDGQGYYKLRASIRDKQQKLRKIEKELNDASFDTQSR